MNKPPVTPDAEMPEKALQPEKKSRWEDEIDAAISQSNVQEEKKKLRKRQLKWGGLGTLALLFIYWVYALFIPFEGTMAYGICKIFLELNVRYPNTLRISTVEETGTFVRIWYTQVDAFGEYRMEPIQCYFKPDEQYGFILDKVTIRRREVDPQKVDDLNRILPVIFKHPPDLTLPTPLPDSLKGLQIETERYRTPLF